MIVWSIGLIPVQEWISEARRSRDLKVGSALLSWLMAAALKSLQDSDAEILVPYLDSNEIAETLNRAPRDLLSGRYGIPNRASGWWSQEELSDAASLLRRLQSVIDEQWNVLRTSVSSEVRTKSLGYYVERAGGPFRLIWCALEHSVADPSQPTGDDKIAALREIDRLYAAVKRTRPIAAYHGNPVGKCGQCARRDACGPSDWNGWRQFQRDLDSRPEIQKGHRLVIGERLCPVCVVKRFAGYLAGGPFPSTSEVAANDWLFRVRRFEDLEKLLGQWASRAKAIDLYEDDPYPLLYERTIERRLKTTLDEDEKRNLPTVRQALDDLSSAIETRYPAKLPKHPSDYLAVVTFDGDDMGKRVQNEPETIPRALTSFARMLGAELEPAYRATPFYLGGDEGLILCPIDTCLDLAAHIRDAFENATRSESNQNDRPTISVGVAIFDRERPLAGAIQSARSALMLAKGLDGKNGLSVTVSTASGNTWSAVDHWGTEWNRVLAAIEIHRGFQLSQEGMDIDRRSRLSSGWAYDIEALLETLPMSFFDSAEARAALREEVRRITYRRVIFSEKARKADDTEKAAEKREIWEMLEGSTWWEEPPDPAQRKHLSNQLHLIAFLLRETQPARGEDSHSMTESEALA